METIEIQTTEFKLELSPKVYDGPSPYNMILLARVESSSFSAYTEIDTGTLQFDEFKHQLIMMYNKLKGTAELTGNDHQKIIFEATRTGRIKIKGTLGRFLREEDYKVDFVVEVDQTDLSKSMSMIQKDY